MHDLLYYRRSGRMGPLGLPLMLGFGVGLGALLGIPYAYAVHYCPLIYINFLITMAFGFILGAGINAAARIGKVRNLGMMMIAGLVGGLAAEYVAWVGYVHAVAQDPVWPWSPGELQAFIEVINAQGVWSIKRSTPTGWVLGAVWLIEAGIIVGTAVWLPKSLIGSTPFNEQTGAWADQERMVGPFRLTGDLHTLISRLEAGDVSAVNELAPALPAAASYHQCRITSCADDPEFTLLSLEAVSRTTDNKGKEQVATRSLMRHLFITQAMRKAIEAKAAEPTAPAVAKPAVEAT
jgi:hypothetical protein